MNFTKERRTTEKGQGKFARKQGEEIQMRRKMQKRGNV